MYTYKMIQVPPNISVKAKDNKAGGGCCISSECC